MTMKKRVQFALLFGALAELVLVFPLFAVSRQLLGPLPMWVDILQNFQKPGAPIVLRLTSFRRGGPTNPGFVGEMRAGH